MNRVSVLILHTSFIALVSACGAGDGGVEPSSEPAAADSAPVATTARTVTAAPPISTTLEAPPEVAAPVAPAPAPAPASEPPVAPVEAAPAPKPAPPPVVAPAPAPAPTPEHPLYIECRLEECSACSLRLYAEHPDWYENGSAYCLARSCAVDADCTTLGTDLVCRPYDDGSPLVCRLPRRILNQTCDPSTEDNDCEIGLICADVSPPRCHKLM